MTDLLALESCQQGNRHPGIPTTISTPLKLKAWARYLSVHPDQQFAAYILQGLTNGFHIGFDRQCTKLRQARGNMSSTKLNPAAVDLYVETEKAEGRLIGPIPEALHKHCQLSPIGLIPKKHQPGRWRLIVDLSSPSNGSVNDGINSEWCSMQYATIDQAVSIIQTLGKGTQLSKLDLKNAYRMVPVHPDDQPLLGIRWEGAVYLDAALPFGLRSAPKIFSAVADALTWVMQTEGIQHLLHYLDDFLFLGLPGSRQARAVLEKALEVCKSLGVPVAPNKTEGPSTTLTFLGITIDTVTGELRLPEEKLVRLQQTIRFWAARRSCTKRELLSLIGQLQHAATVVRPGRTFLRRMIDLSARFSKLDHHIRLNAQFRSDLQWWSLFLLQWNGTGFFQPKTPTVVVASDASGAWGCGAHYQSEWFQFAWPESWHGQHIAAKEMVPILFAAAVWGRSWSGQRILCKSDNSAVVTVINMGTARDPLLMHMLRCLFFYAAHYNFSVSASHLPGRLNTGADALSRNNLDNFFSNCPQASRLATPIPTPLAALIVTHRPDWTSKLWQQLFASTLRMASPSPQSGHTNPPNKDS